MNSIKEKIGGFVKSKTFIAIVIVLIIIAVGYYLYSQGYLNTIVKPKEAAKAKDPPVRESYLPLIDQLLFAQDRNLARIKK